MSGSRADQLLPRLLHDWTASTNEDAKPELYAQKITSLCDIEDVEGFCWTLWQAFIDAAQSASGESLRQIDRLVQLVEAIKKANPLLDKNGRVAACWGGECWKDLPLLGPQMRENWSTSRRSRNSSSERATAILPCQRDLRPASAMPEQRYAYGCLGMAFSRRKPARHTSGPTDLPAILQKNIFVARLTQSGVADFSLYGLWALREALEGDIPWSPASPPEYTIPIAHAWIAYAGDTLIKLVDDRVAAGKGGSLWQGQSGFCMDRWQFWKKRLDQLSKCNELDPELRALAVEAAARIGKLITDSGPATGS